MSLLLLFIYRSASRQLDIKISSDVYMQLFLSAAGGLCTVFTVTWDLFVWSEAIPSFYFSHAHAIARHLLVVIEGPYGSGRVFHGESFTASVDSNHNWKLAPVSITSAPSRLCELRSASVS